MKPGLAASLLLISCLSGAAVAAPALQFGWAPKKTPYDAYQAPNKPW